MGEFKRTNVRVFAKKSISATPDTVYWKKFGAPVFLKEYGPVDYIDFSPIEPHYFAVTSSVHVQVYSPVTRLLYKNLSRFQKGAYGGSFRSDGRLLCSGSEENAVKLFDVSTKSLMRVFNGHTSPVHRCFFTIDNLHISSFSDDGSVALWDIPSEKKLTDFTEHIDYVRAGAVSPVSSDIVLSGSYDKTVKMYDLRSHSVVFSVDHGAPVESVLYLQSGGVFVTAGGTEIKIWDCLSGGRLLAKLHNHHKTVICLRLASEGRRLLSAGLDRHVNVYDVSSFKKLHALDYPNGILSMGISKNDDTLVVGMQDGLVSVTRRETERKPTKREQRRVTFKYATDQRPVTTDITVCEVQRNRLSNYDNFLKKFEHTKALNRVLMPVYVNKTPHVTVAVLQVLLARRKLHTAVSGAEHKTILPLLRFLVKCLGDYRFTRVLIDVANVFLDVYEDSIVECGPEAVKLFQKLHDRVREEVALTESLLAIQGTVELMMAASTAGVPRPQTTCAPYNLKPSQSAQDFVVNVS